MADQNEQQGGNEKVEKNYQRNLKKLVAILGGEQNLTPERSVKSDALAGVVETLLKEKREKVIAEVKQGLETLLEKHVNFQKELKAKKQELKQLEINKKKEFSEAANKVFSKISDIDELANQYKESLGSVAEEDEQEEEKE